MEWDVWNRSKEGVFYVPTNSKAMNHTEEKLSKKFKD